MTVDFKHPDVFANRHIGPDAREMHAMLGTLGLTSLDALAAQTVPDSIRLFRALDLPAPKSEQEMLSELGAMAAKNRVVRSFLGMGYSDCFTPPVILRNILENPGWYTQYTPYQSEISQGRLAALLNYHKMAMDLTAMEIANASLLDEATAAAEAMSMMHALSDDETSRAFFMADSCHPQTIDVVCTRARPLGIEVVVGDPFAFDFKKPIFGALLQYPTTDGAVLDYRAFCERAHSAGALVAVAADILALALLTPPGEFGADVAVGSTQRFGVPMGFGGPHAAYFATKLEHARKMPGRLIGVSEDRSGKPALRMALATREQHIRREKATSNICTAQVLLAVTASMYAVYHGPAGIRAIAARVHRMTRSLARGLSKLGIRPRHENVFDTLRIEGPSKAISAWLASADARGMAFRCISDTALGISLDETTTAAELRQILDVFGASATLEDVPADLSADLPAFAKRQSAYLTHPVFSMHHSETAMLRYMKTLESRDLSLTHSMIPLGSCTMKLNATAEMIPVTWPAFGNLHPFAPPAQTRGYQALFASLEKQLAEITGFAGISLQPNAGSQGEYAGLLVIRKYHENHGQSHRNVCLIPSSAHGTNPASAVMAGMKVVVTACDKNGNVDVADLEAKARAHKNDLAALMVTYPSTHGVFEEDIRRVCAIVHENGGQVYMDGANMNAQVGLCRPGDIGADVCHLNLHKTFCIPHGGGGPGMGPIGVASHLVKFLPRHSVVNVGGSDGIGAVSAAPWGSASILTISWAYITMMGAKGLTEATKVAILNANYIAARLEPHFPVVYKGKQGRIAHECILDMRQFKKSAGIEVDDIAKRLMDYGFHSPTMSFPIAGTFMIEPTESESKAELDRFCDAMISIREEIRDIEEGRAPREGNVLENAPHTADAVTKSEWPWSHSRDKAAFPLPWVRKNKFWPSVGRLNNVLGDRKLFCSCPPIEDDRA